jgi:hypothetical protein
MRKELTNGKESRTENSQACCKKQHKTQGQQKGLHLRQETLI